MGRFSRVCNTDLYARLKYNPLPECFMELMCFTKAPFWTKLSRHIVHLYLLFVSCIPECTFSSFSEENVNVHTVHLWVLIFWWTLLMWIPSAPFCVNVLEHFEQECAFTPVWVNKWGLRYFLFLKVPLQCGHLCLLSILLKVILLCRCHYEYFFHRSLS